jgi:hypothetical protein
MLERSPVGQTRVVPGDVDDFTVAAGAVEWSRRPRRSGFAGLGGAPAASAAKTSNPRVPNQKTFALLWA